MSGVVSESREIRSDLYLELGALFQGRLQEPRSPDKRPTMLPLKWAPAAPGASFHTVDLQALVESAEGVRGLGGEEAAMASFWP